MSEETNINNNRKINYKILVFALTISFIQHFPYLLDSWFNTWLLARDYPFLKSILDMYETIETSFIGTIFYFHIYSYGLIVSYADTAYYIWVHFSFVVAAVLWYLLIFFINRKIKSK